MDLELHFTKGDNDVWGFRIVGGAEYDVPFTVVNVAENGISENGGLKIEDVIVSVNGTPIVGLIHNHAHKLLLDAGNSLTLGIRREPVHLAERVECEDENNEEVSNIMQVSLENEECFNYQKETQFEIIHPDEESNHVETNGVYPEEQNTISNGHATLNEVELQRKWSTFLQKPQNAKPVLKKSNEEVSQAEPYRVIIKKQPKKEILQKSEKDNSVSNDNNEVTVCEEDNSESNINESDEVPVEVENEDGDEEPKDEDQLEKIDEDNRSLEENEEDRNQEDEPKSEKNALLEKMLEEKLAEVQKQLEALSKLPSTIQSTIEAVTKQIATIVHVTTSTETCEETMISESSSIADLAENDISEGRDDSDEKLDEEMEVDGDANEKVDVDENEIDLEGDEELVKDEVVEMMEGPEPTEEEIEAARIAEELLEKQKKELELIEEFKQRRLKQKPTLPLKPVERPIILPGGRRWSQPDDACPVVKDKKMSDEKIANTIETYSEVILGKTKGINFMKYQPPPKNLDYLHRSDVYKLVHDMEPPVRGISSRVSKVLSEQDYYQTGLPDDLNDRFL